MAYWSGALKIKSGIFPFLVSITPLLQYSSTPENDIIIFEGLS
jgi:hypothetical protein